MLVPIPEPNKGKSGLDDVAGFRPRFSTVMKHILGNDEIARQVKPIIEDPVFVQYGIVVDNGASRYSLNVTEDQHAIHAETAIASTRQLKKDFLMDLHELNYNLSAGKVSITPPEIGTSAREVVYGITVPKSGVPTQTVANEIMAFDRGVSEISNAVSKLAELRKVNSKSLVYNHVTPVESMTWKILGAFNGTAELPPGKEIASELLMPKRRKLK